MARRLDMVLADRLKAARRRKEWSQRDLARESGVPYTTIWRLENGRTAEPKMGVLQKLSDALDTSIDYLVGSTQSMETDSALLEVDKVERAYEFARGDTDFQFGTRLRGELSIEAKRFIVELYEKATGKKLL
jgi:transcriptional regulator with XRE-family HTH domain